MATAKCWGALNHRGNTLIFVYTVTMLGSIVSSGRTCGVVMKRPMLFLAVGALLGVLAQPVLAFEEGTPGTTGDKPEAAMSGVDAPKAPTQGKGLNLKMPELSIGQGTGTEVRIPGIGKVGVLPKLDFGLELLYGATESKGLPQDKTEPGDVQIRGTIKHRF